MARRTHHNDRGTGRGATLAALTALITVVPLGLGTLPARASDAAPAPGRAFAAKSDAKLARQFAAEDGRAKVTFWVNLTGTADNSGAHEARGKKAKSRAVYDTMTAYAEKAQAGLLDQVAEEGGTATSFWIANTVKVTGRKALADKIAARADVASLESDEPLEIPDPLPGDDEPKADAVGGEQKPRLKHPPNRQKGRRR
ncbi:hypothetical protein [Streptomyces sp. NPDC059604]|uniref:hypothetical protein n=1 Tax=Streptomyces sp. NPDC059604 TaxID=3346881 RepID=UPI0036C63511